MKNPNPECPREDCKFVESDGIETLAYYPPVYDKNGVNINWDKNKVRFNVNCITCGKIWRGATCMGETTYEEVKND
jgi:hypothetical protein